MSDVQKVELTVPIDETELLRFLLDRFGADELRRAGVFPESSVIRGLDIEPGGKCSFRVCAVSVSDPTALVEQIHAEGVALEAEASQTDGEGLTIDYEAPEESADGTPRSTTPSCPVAEQTLVRIRKRKETL